MCIKEMQFIVIIVIIVSDVCANLSLINGSFYL